MMTRRSEQSDHCPLCGKPTNEKMPETFAAIFAEDRRTHTMQDDPDAPDYEYPEQRRRLWHTQWKQWVIVRGADGPTEVLVEREDTGMQAMVKLRDLRPRRGGQE